MNILCSKKKHELNFKVLRLKYFELGTFIIEHAEYIYNINILSVTYT